MNEKKIKLNIIGNFYSICKDEDGHELWASASISLTKKDFKKWDNRKWKDFFRKLNNNRFEKADMMDLYYSLPKVLFEKVKKTEEELFNNSKYYCLCHILISKFDIDNSSIDCELDFFR